MRTLATTKKMAKGTTFRPRKNGQLFVRTNNLTKSGVLQTNIYPIRYDGVSHILHENVEVTGSIIDGYFYNPVKRGNQ